MLLFWSSLSWCENISPEKLLSLPEPMILGNNDVCQNEAGVIYQLDNNLEPGITYDWAVTGGTIVGPSDSTVVVIDWGDESVGNDGLIVMTVSNPSCSVFNNYGVKITPPEEFTFEIISGGNYICAGDTVTFVAVPSTLMLNTDTPSYTWFVNNQAVGTNDPMFVLTDAMNGDIVHCEAKIGPYCVLNTEATSDPVTMNVTSISDSNIFLAADQDTICEGDNISFTAFTMPQFGWSYQWQLNGVNVGLDNQSYTGVSLSDGDQIICTASNSCEDTVSDTITVNARDAFLATIMIEADVNPICAGDSITFTSTVTNAGDSPGYQWQVNGGNIANETSSTFGIRGLNDGDLVTCTMFSSSNCAIEPIVTSSPIEIEIASGIQTSVTLSANPNPFCEGDDVDFTATVSNPAPGQEFTWFVNGSQYTTILGGFLNIPGLNNADEVSVTYSANFDECFQQGTLSDTITLDGQDAIAIGVTLSADKTQICAGETITFTPSPVGGGTAPKYDWFLNGNSLNIDTDTFITNNIINGDVLSIEMTTSLTCPLNGDSTAMSNALMISVSDLALDIVSLTPACNEQGTIEVEASGGIFGNYSYLWDNGQTGPIASGLGADTYSVTVIDQIGCSESISSIDVMAVDAPQILSASTSIASCGFNDGSIAVDVAGGLLPYDVEWTNESGMLVSTDLQQPAIAGGIYTLILTDANGCRTTETYTVPQENPSRVVAPEDVTINLGDSIRIVAYAETLDTVEYMWSPPVGVSCLTCPITYLNPYETTTYTLTMMQTGGCISSDSITVTVLENQAAFIPNVFSPNFDGNNDIYMVYGGAGVAQMKSFRIYSRWGALLHSVENVPTNDKNYGWDGSYKDRSMPTGVYVYYVELELLNGTTKNYRGNLTLVR